MAANDTRRLRVVVTGESGDAQEALEQVGEAADQTESKLVTLTRTLAVWAGRGAIALGAVGAAAVTMGVSTASQLEQVEVGFTTMLGSAQKAQKFMKELQDFAAATPFEFTELVGSAQRFLAMGFAAKDVIPMLTAVGDAVAAMGGSAESVDSVTRALGQMQAKGKVSGEELMQLTEQGIPALKILADQYGVSTMEMSKMIEKGEVMSSKAIPLLIKGLRDGTTSVKGFGGMMDKQSETMKGKWSTFMDTMRMGLGNIAKNFLPAMKGGIETLSDAMGNFFAGIQGKGALQGFKGTINEIGLGLRAMIGAFKEGDVTSDGLVGKFELMGAALKGIIVAFQTGKVQSGGWRSILETLAIVIQKLITVTKELAQVVGSVIGFFQDNELAARALWITLGLLVAVTKAHAIATGVQAAGGLLAMFKNLTLVTTTMKVAAAVQWAWNGAIAAASYLQIAGYLAALNVAQKANVVWTKAMTAATWAWSMAQKASPIGMIITAIGALVAAVVYLWNNNEGFRKWVLNTLWPSLKRAWDQLKNAVMVVIDAIVTAWTFMKNHTMAIWNAVWGFLSPIVNKIIQGMMPIITVIMKIADVFRAFYTTVWKVIWIAIQVAVKIFIMYLQNVLIPIFTWAFNKIASGISWLYNNVWKPHWDKIKLAVQILINWITNVFIPGLQKAWNWIKNATQSVRNFVVEQWNQMLARIKFVYQQIAGPIANILQRGINTVKGWINNFRTGWNLIFDGVKKKTDSVMGGVISAFNKGRDGIKRAWESIKNITKAPINFVINDVYNNRIRTLWNKVAEKFGIKTRLDVIPKLAKGGVVGRGYGTQDDQLALLMRGEGVLTTGEMKRLGGPKGFQEFRQSLAAYGKGGVVGGDGIGGWIKSLASKGKDIFQGLAGAAIKPLVSTIRRVINGGLGTDGFAGLMRSGGHSILDRLVSWVSGKDKEIGNLGGSGGNIGYKVMQALIRTVFPTLRMLSGFRPGARTLSGNPSYHGVGRAVDYPANRALALWIRNTFGGRTKELITPWHDLNLLNGRPHRYTGAIWNQHNFAGGNAHVHWAMDSASVVQPGWFAGYNGTGKPETLVNADKIGPGNMYVTINVNGSGNPKAVAKEIRDELIKLSRRNGGVSGLPSS